MYMQLLTSKTFLLITHCLQSFSFFLSGETSRWNSPAAIWAWLQYFRRSGLLLFQDRIDKTLNMLLFYPTTPSATSSFLPLVFSSLLDLFPYFNVVVFFPRRASLIFQRLSYFLFRGKKEGRFRFQRERKFVAISFLTQATPNQREMLQQHAKEMQATR